MAIEFRCEKCGKLLSAEAEPGSTIRCPHCNKKVAVPAVLASLPQPQVPDAAGAAPPPPPPAPPPPGGPAAEEQMVEEEEPGSDAVMGVMAYIMPWIISIFFHLGLALILLFVAMIVVVDTMPENVIVPDDVLSETPGGQINPGHGNPNLRASQPRPTQSTAESDRDTSIPQDTGETAKQIMLIGRAKGGASGGELAPWGKTSGGSGGGPRSNFFGHGGNAYHIVYVIDRSGSMVETFDIVRNEMLISISRLRKEQDFHVILFAKGTPMEATSRRLVMATPRNKEQTAVFLEEIRPAGQTDPIPALERAFTVLKGANPRRPGKLIYLLTDGNFPDNAAVLSRVRELNENKKVHINTYLYGNKPPEAERVMRQIAKENGGRYKYVSPDE